MAWRVRSGGGVVAPWRSRTKALVRPGEVKASESVDEESESESEDEESESEDEESGLEDVESESESGG